MSEIPNSMESDDLCRDLSRAQWQRGAGAIIMRELTEGAFDEVPSLNPEDINAIWDNAHEDTKLYSHEGLSLLWSAAYNTSDFVVSKAFAELPLFLNDAKAEELSDSIGSDFEKYVWASHPPNAMTEAKRTMAHFPVSLARSICNHAQYSIDPLSGLYQPQSLAEIALMLERTDFRLMINQAMFAANGFWRGIFYEYKQLSNDWLSHRSLWIYRWWSAI